MEARIRTRTVTEMVIVLTPEEIDLARNAQTTFSPLIQNLLRAIRPSSP